MKRAIPQRKVTLITKPTWKDGKKCLQYYIQVKGTEPVYAFERNFSTECCALCSTGMPISELMVYRSKNDAVMNLVKYVNLIIPYLMECYELPAVEKAGNKRLMKQTRTDKRTRVVA